MDSLNILPPDKDVFHEVRKPVSDKQKSHLVKAREAAKATIERRRRLEQEEKEREQKEQEEKKGKLVDLSTDEKILESEEEEEEVKPKKKVKAKKVETEGDTELRRFEKFMKNMKLYEQCKIDHQKALEEAQKVKVSYNKEEYDHILNLLERDSKEKELQKLNPSKTEKQKEQEEPNKTIKAGNSSYVRNLRMVQNKPRSRFDRG